MKYITIIDSVAYAASKESPCIYLNADNRTHMRKIPGGGNNPKFLTGYIINKTMTSNLEVNFQTNRREAQPYTLAPLEKLKVAFMPCDDLLVRITDPVQDYGFFEYSFTSQQTESEEESINAILQQEFRLEKLTQDQAFASTQYESFSGITWSNGDFEMVVLNYPDSDLLIEEVTISVNGAEGTPVNDEVTARIFLEWVDNFIQTVYVEKRVGYSVIGNTQPLNLVPKSGYFYKFGEDGRLTTGFRLSVLDIQDLVAGNVLRFNIKCKRTRQLTIT